MSEKRTYTYKVVDGCEIQADAFGITAGEARPVLLWLHGGALVCGTRERMRPAHLRLYTEAGYVVVAIDYRLAPETKLPGIIEDLQDACLWLRTEGPALLNIDPGRLAAIGHSAGGYLALMSGCCIEPRPRAIVSFYGYGDIAADWYSRPDPFYCRQPMVSEQAAYAAVGKGVVCHSTDPERPARYYLYLRQRGLWPLEVSGLDPVRQRSELDRYCPERRVDPSYPPTLLLHGTADTDVPSNLSVAMGQALDRAGVEHELLLFPGAGHGFDAAEPPPDSSGPGEVLGRVLAFLERHLAKSDPTCPAMGGSR